MHALLPFLLSLTFLSSPFLPFLPERAPPEQDQAFEAPLCR